MSITTALQTTARPRPRIRKVAVAAALGATLATAGAASAAEAAQSNVQQPGSTTSYATYFWGRTEVCFKNVDYVNKDVAYNWWSSTSNGSGYLTPGQHTCMTRSFAGFRIGVYDIGGDYLQVTFPIGP